MFDKLYSVSKELEALGLQLMREYPEPNSEVVGVLMRSVKIFSLNAKFADENSILFGILEMCGCSICGKSCKGREAYTYIKEIGKFLIEEINNTIDTIKNKLLPRKKKQEVDVDYL